MIAIIVFKRFKVNQFDLKKTISIAIIILNRVKDPLID